MRLLWNKKSKRICAEIKRKKGAFYDQFPASGDTSKVDTKR